MRLVLDSNVLVAAFATRGACAELFARVLSAHAYAVDDNILAEVRRTLTGKLRLPRAKVVTTLDLVRATASVIVPEPLGTPVCRDPDDDRILALALSFDADAVVTGDDDLLVLHPWKAIAIVRPRDFWHLDRSERK